MNLPGKTEPQTSWTSEQAWFICPRETAGIKWEETRRERRDTRLLDTCTVACPGMCECGAVYCIIVCLFVLHCENQTESIRFSPLLRAV